MEVQGTTGTSTDYSGTTQMASSASELGKDEFLKLLMAQLQNQDPLSPMDNTEYIAQMAQFSTVEQLTNLNSTLSNIATSQSKASAVAEATALIGHQVTLQVPDSSNESDGYKEVTGAVTSVKLVSGWPQIVIDGESYDPSYVSEVA